MPKTTKERKIKAIVNLTEITGGWRASAHFTFLTRHGPTSEIALNAFVEQLKLRNYEIVYKKKLNESTPFKP